MEVKVCSEILHNKKVAVLLETEYISSEIDYYINFFSKFGAEVHLLTYLWGAKSRVLVSDVTEPNIMPSTITVTKDISDYNPEDYAIVLIAANYVACRLREIMPMGSLGSIEELSTPPAVGFIKRAMENKKIIKGALCHGLWLLTPIPQCLSGRKVICHTVVLADIHNAGAIYVPEESHVVVDDDLITARSAADIEKYCQTIIAQYEKQL